MPLHLRNAPTRLMKELDYGKGYQYAHDEADAVADMDCLPESLAGRRYYQPTERGFEKEIKRRLDGWDEIKEDGGKKLTRMPDSSRTRAAPSRITTFVPSASAATSCCRASVGVACSAGHLAEHLRRARAG